MAPRLSSRKPQHPAPPPPRDAKPGDNARGIVEARNAQLLSFLAKAREKKAVVDKAATVLKSAKDELNEVFRHASAANKEFTRARLSELMADMSSPQLRKNITEAEAIRAEFRRVCGLPVGDEGKQADLIDNSPETAKDQMHYRALGYTAGLAGENGAIPDFVPSNFGPDYSQGWKDGQKILIEAKIKSSAPKAPATPKTDAREKTAADEKLEAKRAEKTAKEALDAAADTPLAKARRALAELVDADATPEEIADAQEAVAALEGPAPETIN